MKYKSFIVLFISLSFGCTSAIKDNHAQAVIEEGAYHETDSSSMTTGKNVYEGEGSLNKSPKTFWVGFFNPHKDIDLKGKFIFADEGLYWGRQNKISISIDSILGDSIIGHSVVAGNHRPFYGQIKISNNGHEYIVREPGDNMYDGQFIFSIKDGYLIGTWDAYKDLEIPKREFKLSQVTYIYNPDVMLDKNGRYGNWEKFIDHGKQIEIYDEGTPYEEVYEWVKMEYASSTEKIYQLNASNTLLTKKDVENLTNSDLVVIRNTIYARHGYSFKNRPLRVFFDAQDWYIPVHADIKQEFTEIEKQNIQLLLRYEKNAKEYYDYFGRG